MAIAFGLKQQGAQSATWYKAAAGTLGATVVDDVNTDWDELSSGKLKDLLNTTYAAADGDTAIQVFLAAFAAAGGSVAVTGDVAADSTYVWSISVAGYPVLTFTTTDGTRSVVRIQTSYSASE